MKKRNVEVQITKEREEKGRKDIHKKYSKLLNNMNVKIEVQRDGGNMKKINVFIYNTLNFVLFFLL